MSRTRGVVRRLTWRQVAARRLARQGLVRPGLESTPAEVVAAMCGAHAQVLSAAEVSVALRLARGTRADVQDALWREHSLVKTFGPRGTVHLLPTRELSSWCGALSAVPRPRSPFADDVRLTPGQTEAVLAAIAEALVDAELTTDELTAAVVQRAGAWAGDLVMPAFQARWPRWRQALALAGVLGLLCFGANRGRNVTYTSPRRWSPGLVLDDGDEALGRLVRRYLAAYGPVTPQHFATWLNASPTWATDVFGSLDDEVEEVELEGIRGWQLAGDTTPREPPTGLLLLPHFDSYTVACQPRELLFPGVAARRALANGQAGNHPVLIVDGTVAGVWQIGRSGTKVAITVEPLAPLSARRLRQLDDEVGRLGEVLGAAVRLTLGTVTVGAHA